MLSEAIQAFQGLTDIQGRVFLVGQIVQAGQSNDIEIAVTEPSDRQKISQQLPQYSGQLVFHGVSAEPSEPHVEVTPGVVAKPGGTQPSLEQIHA